MNTSIIVWMPVVRPHSEEAKETEVPKQYYPSAAEKEAAIIVFWALILISFLIFFVIFIKFVKVLKDG